MSLSPMDDLLSAHVPTMLDRMGVAIGYTPEGGSERTIQAIVDPGNESVFGNSADHDYDLTEIEITSADDTDGVIAPNITARDGAGDTITGIPGSAATWYVKRILVDGRIGSNMHRLLIASTEGLLVGD